MSKDTQLPVEEKLLTLREAATFCRVHPLTITRWARAGLLPVAARTPGGHRRYRESDLRKIMSVQGGES